MKSSAVQSSLSLNVPDVFPPPQQDGAADADEVEVVVGTALVACLICEVKKDRILSASLGGRM